VAIVVIGGQSRSVGKTSVVASLIARLPERRWTAFKITQYGHGFCTADGKPCQCATADSCVSITPERDPDSGTDTARFLAAGAVRSLWVRTRIGMLAEAVPRIQEELARSENAILESNSILDYFEPDLYLTVLDPAVTDFKDSARRLLNRADAVLWSSRNGQFSPSHDRAGLNSKPQFAIAPPSYISDEIVDFVRERLARLTTRVSASTRI
jgi:molybdopterin-guanine dinucleotide biosynthesis protein